MRIPFLKRRSSGETGPSSPSQPDGPAAAPASYGRLLRRRRLQVLLASATLPPLLLLGGACVAWHHCGLNGCPNVDRLRSFQPGRASRLLDRSGRPFAELRPVRGETVPLSRVPRQVREAFLAVEDRRFYEHGALDWRRVVGAFLHNLRRMHVDHGFSTITMQLARNVFPDRIRGQDQTLGRKLVEIRVAREIEDRFAKDEILELYLSHIYFGNGARGIEAAARHYFGSSASRLNLSQGALLAALIRGPSYYDPRRHPQRARARRDLVLQLMEKQKRITREEAQRARGAPLGIAARRPWTGGAPGTAAYFVEEVRKQVEDRFGERTYDETLSIVTTLDLSLQRDAEESLEQQLRAVEAGRLGRFDRPRYAATPGDANGSPYLQGALVALEAATGDVLAWIGGRDFRHSRFDRVRSARRQVGSAFKPFVYAAALREKHYLSEHLEDAPLRMRLPNGRVWEPKNFDAEYDGDVTLREALVRSKNVPTVRLGNDVGIRRVARVAREAGIESDMDETPALPLGTVALSPLELTRAYGAFATLGEIAEPRLVLRVDAETGERLFTADEPKRKRVLDAGVAFLVTDVLREALERGTGAAVRAAGFAGDAAGKTGTTNEATDAWFVGYTPTLVASVWIGFDEPRPIMAAATGSRLAAPVWGRMMARARSAASVRWRVPSEVTSLWVDPESGSPLEDGCRPDGGFAMRELFLESRIPDRVCPDRGWRWLIPDQDRYQPPSDEEEARRFDLWPEDAAIGSEPSPADDEEVEARPQRWPDDRDRGESVEERRRIDAENERFSREQRRLAEKRWREWKQRFARLLAEIKAHDREKERRRSGEHGH